MCKGTNVNSEAAAALQDLDTKGPSLGSANSSSDRVSTLQDLEDYESRGFLHTRGVFDEETLGKLRGYVDELQNAPEEKGGTMMYFEKSSLDGSRILSRIEDYCRHHAGMAELFADPDSRLVRLAQELHGDEEMVLFKDKINFKLSGGDGFKAHQDQQAGWGKVRSFSSIFLIVVSCLCLIAICGIQYINWFVTVAVIIDEATIENGCLEVAPGMHKQGLLGEEWKPIDDLDLPYEHVPCQPGDVLVFDSYLPHRSGPNRSEKCRRAVFLTYNLRREGNHLADYYADKRREFPPDIERPEGVEYVYRV